MTHSAKFSLIIFIFAIISLHSVVSADGNSTMTIDEIIEALKIFLKGGFPSIPALNETITLPPPTLPPPTLPPPTHPPTTHPPPTHPPLTRPPPPTIPVCGLLSDGSIDYTKGGSNWCDICLTGHKQSPINIPNAMPFIMSPPFIDIDVNITFGYLRRVAMDFSKNFVQANYRSDGYMRVEGSFPNGTDIYEVLKPTGHLEFHTPSEHTFGNGTHYDVELEIYY